MHKESHLLRFKLLITFVVFCLMPMLCIAIYSYFYIEKQLTNSALSHLEAITKMKSSQIDRFYKKIENDVLTIQESPYVKNIISVHSALKGDTESGEYKKQKGLVAEQLRSYISKREIDEVYIFALDGCTIACSRMKKGNSSIQYDNEAFKKGKEGLYFSDIYMGHEQNKSFLFTVSAPIFDNGKLVGVVVTEVVTDSFFEQIQDTAGLGMTGETLLCKRYGETVLFLNPLRHDPNAALVRCAQIGGQLATPALRGSSGQTGSGLATDYRGVAVLAAWRYIPSTGWGMVGKMDAAEVLYPLGAVRNSIILTAVILLIFGIAASYKMAIDMMRPVQKLETQASHDSLTGLPNRMMLTDLLDQALAKAKIDDTLVGVMFLDLDGFKAVNDTHGHKSGDMLLKEVAHRLGRCVRQSDTVARLGGDEFVVLLCGIKEIVNITHIATVILQKLNEEFVLGDITAKIGVSIGISIFPNNGTRSDEMIRLADAAMYEAKKSGKNNYKIADSCLLSNVLI